MSVKDSSTAGLIDRSTSRQISPIFPKTRNSLWDKTSRGQPTFLHLGHYRKPRICVPEKILKLVQHQCENYGQGSYLLLGSLVVDADGEGVQIQVDRLDTRTNVSLTSVDLTVGSVAISFQVTNNAPCERTPSADVYIHALELLQSRCCSKDSINLCEFLHLCGYGSFYSSAHTTVAHLDFDLVTLDTGFKCTPITPVPVAVTALSKNLVTPRNLSSLQGTPKTGYLTMDSTRKVMLVLESDPKCANLAIVGIWVSGVEFLHHPFVWAACLRYIHCTHLQDRVCTPPEDFLLALYTPLQTRPEFFQCATNSRDSCLQFGLNTGHEVVNMDKMLASPSSGDFVEVELEPVQDGQKKEIFDAAKEQHCSSMLVKDAGFIGSEDLEPRCAPMPHAENVPVFHPIVPEVSVLWTEPYEQFNSPGLTPGDMPHSEYSSQQRQTVGSREELSSQRYPQHSFSQPQYTTPAYGQQVTGHYQQPQVFHTRSPMSYQYSPARQRLDAPATHPSQFLPQNVPSPHSQQHFYGNGGGILPSTHTVPQGYHMYPQNTSPHLVTTAGPPRHHAPPTPHLVTTAGLPRHHAPPTPQTSQPISSYHITSSSKTNYHDPMSAPSSQNRNQQLGTPGFAQVNSQGPPFPGFDSNGYKIHDQKNYNSNGLGVAHINTQIDQNVNHSQFMNTSVANGVQQPGALTPQVHTQTHTGYSGNLNPPAGYASQTYQLSSSKGPHNNKETLKTIHEESSFSQTLLQPQEGPHTRMLEADGHVRTAESSASSLRLPSVNSSVRSSANDSGLDASSDRLNMSLPRHGTDSLVPTDSCPCPTKTCASAACSQENPVGGIRWEQVPPEVITVLLQQSKLLEQLQQEVQTLKSQIAQTNKAPPPDQASAGSVNQQTKSVSVNTSFVNNPITTSQDYCDSISTQGTPARHGSRQQEFVSPANSCHHTGTPKPGQLPVEACQIPAGQHTTPAVPSVGQSGHQSPQGSCSCVQRELSQGQVDLDNSSMQSFDQTVNSDLSEPESASFIDRSQSDRSPSSASEYNRQSQESDSTVGSEAAAAETFRKHIVSLVDSFIQRDGQGDSPSSLPVASEPQRIRSTQGSPSKLQTEADCCVVAEASPMPMSSVWEADPNQTMELNALAMKYFSDEQLTNFAKLSQTAPNNSHSSASSAKILQQVMNGGRSSLAENVLRTDLSQYGMSACDMTMDTFNYMQRYGLTGNDRSILGVSMLGADIRLRTDFSIVATGSVAGRINLSQSFLGDEGQLQQLRVDPEMSCDVNNENWQPVAKSAGGQRGMGVLPMLPGSKNSAREGGQGYAGGDQLGAQGNSRRRNVLQEVSPQAFVNVKKGDKVSPLVKAWSNQEGGENHTLDLETLKQMPKLL